MPYLPPGAVLFGRQPDMDYLRKRVQTRGLTVITGPPKRGKTTLVQSLCDDLAAEGAWITGHYWSTASEHDSLSHTIQAAFENWLSDSSLRDRAKSYIDRHKKDFRDEVGEFVAGLITDAAKGIPVVGHALGNAIAKLKGAPGQIRDSGIQLPPVPYEIARDLVNTMTRVSEKRILLVLDAWEQGQTLEHDYGSLSKFLGNLHEWAEGIHIVVVVRDGPKYANARELSDDLCMDSVLAERFALPPMNLADSAESTRLIDFVRKRLPAATRDMTDGAILELIGGNPGVVGDWIQKPPATETEMRVGAGDTHASTYRELEHIVMRLIEDEVPLFDVAARLTLIQELNDRTDWEQLEEVVLSGVHRRELARLEGNGLLQSSNPPSFGHTTRYEAMRRLLTEDKRIIPYARQVAEELIPACAAGIKSVDSTVKPFSSALVAIHPTADALAVSEDVRWIPLATQTLFGIKLTSADVEVVSNNIRSGVIRHPKTAVVAAMALVNTLNHVKEEQDLERRDSLFDELREVHRVYPADTAVRKEIAKGLFNTLVDAKEEQDIGRRDGLLDELRELHRVYPADTAGREWLAKGLVNTLVDAKEEQDLGRRDSLFDELRELQHVYPADAAVREQLVMGLFNTLIDAKEEQNLGRRDSLLDELRELQRVYPADAAVREWLAMGLFNTLFAAKEDRNLERRDSLHDELRELIRAFPGDKFLVMVARSIDAQEESEET